ncbi:MAG: saccharopine dehydrogenase NADP-binding domain-containing protein, partial [Actinomycetales bacterium]
MTTRFTNKVLILGAGSVSQSVLPLLIEHLVDAKQITIMDQRDNRARVKGALDQGATYVQDQITQSNLDAQLSKYLSAGDFLLDLAWNIDANTILQWCHDHGVLYLNTSVEEWDPYEGGSNKHPLERTLYYRHMRMREMKSKWTKTGATAIVEHGANPGLVSHLVKKALVDIATKGLSDGKVGKDVESALTDERYNELSHLLDVKVIHISERDTQVTNKPKQWG